MGVACIQCRADLAEGARFCSACGAPVSPASPGSPGSPASPVAPGADPGGPLPALGPRYRILRFLGRGGMGRVYLCHDEQLDVDVAVKVLPDEVAGQPDALEQIQREARAAARLRDGPGILSLYGFEQVNGTWCLVMEYAAGGSLHERLRRETRLPEPECRRLGAEVAAGLAFAHGRRIVHRDIKPANVLLDAAGHAKVTDFGIARVLSETSSAMSQTAVAGTPAYMAPEVILRRRADARADLYALGCMLFEMSTGQRPFTGSYVEIAVAKTAPGARVPRPTDVRPNLSPTFDAIVARLLAQDPDARFPDAGACAAALRGDGAVAVRPLPSRAGPTTPASVLPRQPATLVVRCAPAGARIAVDELDRGEAGPDGLVITGLDPAVPHFVHASLDDHEPASEGPLLCAAGETTEIRVTLRRTTSLFSVVSGVPGARVRLERGGADPITLTLDESGRHGAALVEVGDYAVLARRHGFETWQGRIRVRPGVVAELALRMTELDGTLTVDSEPAGADVTAGGRALGRTPLRNLRLPAGTHALRFVHAGHEDLDVEAVVRGEEDTDLGTLHLVPLATLDLTGLPADAAARVDGEPAEGRILRPQGEVAVEVTRPRHRPQALRLRLLPGETVAPVLGPWVPNRGALDLRGAPAGSTVTVDGAAVDRRRASLPLDAGSHRVGASRPGFVPVDEVTVEVRPDEVTPFPDFSWIPLSSALVRTLPAGAEVEVDGAPRGAAPAEGLLVEGLDPRASHTFRATLAGHEAATRGPLSWRPGVREELRLHLRRREGTAVVAGAPEGATATFTRPGTEPVVAAAGGLAGTVLAEGRWEVTVEAPGHEPFTGTVAVPDRGTVRVEARLRERPGSLSVRTDPPGAEVLIDGVPAGRSPLERGPVAAGAHVVLLRSPGREDVEVRVAVRCGEDRDLGTVALPAAATAPAAAVPGATAAIEAPPAPDPAAPAAPAGPPAAAAGVDSPPVAPPPPEPRRGPAVRAASATKPVGGPARAARRRPRAGVVVAGLVAIAGTLALALLGGGLPSAPDAAGPPRPPARGTLVVRTDPPGATISVDGRDRGVAGPGGLVLAHVDAYGPHAVAARLAGHRGVEVRDVRVRRGERNVVALTLPRLVGRLRLQGGPPGATVHLACDGAPARDLALGDDGIAGPVEIEAGTWQVSVTAPGFRPRTLEALVEDGATTALDVALEPEPGALDLSALPADVVVTVDGRPVARAGGPVEVAPGEHTVALRRPGYRPVPDRRVSVAAGSTTRIVDPTWTALTPTITPAVPGLPPPPEAVLAAQRALAAIPDGLVRDDAGRIWCVKDGAEMVLIPAGEFLMGATEGDGAAEDDEKPRHRVHVSAFLLDRHEITNAQFARFVKETGHRTEAEKTGKGWALAGGEWKAVDGADWRRPEGPGSTIEGRDHHPVVLVSWEDAAAYCEWAGRRLPTEAEFEKALRGGVAGQVYPWGNAEVPPAGTGNYADASFQRAAPRYDAINGYDDGHARTAPAGAFAPNAFGLFDISGNVWEWCADRYDASHYASRAAGVTRDPKGPETGLLLVARGGGWLDPSILLRSANRARHGPTIRGGGLGCRAARGLL